MFGEIRKFFGSSKSIWLVAQWWINIHFKFEKYSIGKRSWGISENSSNWKFTQLGIPFGCLCCFYSSVTTAQTEKNRAAPTFCISWNVIFDLRRLMKAFVFFVWPLASSPAPAGLSHPFFIFNLWPKTRSPRGLIKCESGGNKGFAPAGLPNPQGGPLISLIDSPVLVLSRPRARARQSPKSGSRNV